MCLRRLGVSAPSRTSSCTDPTLAFNANSFHIFTFQPSHAHLDHPLRPPQDIILDRHAIARGCAGAPQLGPLTTPPARSGAACDPRVVHAAWVQRLQRIHHPDTTTNAKTNTSSFNSNSSTGAGTGPESTSTHANMATGATDADSDESIVTAGTGTDNTAGMGMGSGTGLEHWSTSCYLLASHPSLVQHVGASSALFGASSSRFHVALDFPTRVAVPGFDGPDGWRRRRHLQRRHRQ